MRQQVVEHAWNLGDGNQHDQLICLTEDQSLPNKPDDQKIARDNLIPKSNIKFNVVDKGSKFCKETKLKDLTWKYHDPDPWSLRD
eukprot:9858254-Karenia_brevis.AAC.1